MAASRYPKATWLGKGQSGGSMTGGPYKVVLHTTETAGIPTYSGGATAPHLTYYAAKRQWVQHVSFLYAARALRNEAGGVQTNRDSALQVEIVAYSDKNMVDKYGGGRVKVSQLTEANLGDLADFLKWASREFGVKLRWPGKQALSYSQANARGFRMTGPEWDAYGGVCGHQHVPENFHWDPGAIRWSSLITPQTPQAQEAQMTYAKTGDPINTLADARAATANQGSIIPPSDFDYDENDPRFIDERLKVFIARVVDMLVQHDVRIRSAQAEAESAKATAVASASAAAQANARVDGLLARIENLEARPSGTNGASTDQVVAEVVRRLSNG